MINISAVIITYNEEGKIARCLDSLKGIADEIIVVDSFSTDKTKEICQSYGVRYFEREWKGYGEQKNWANQQASNRYVLSLDADECLSPQLQQSILAVKSNWTHDAYIFNRLNIYCGKPIKYGSWYPDRKLRLWDKSKGCWDNSEVHELVKMQVNAKVARLKGDIIHYSYTSINEHAIRTVTYSDLWVKKALKNNKKSTLTKWLFTYPWRFILSYVFRLGFLDGYYGMVVSNMIAYEAFLKYAKLHQHKKEIATISRTEQATLKPVLNKLATALYANHTKKVLNTPVFHEKPLYGKKSLPDQEKRIYLYKLQNTQATAIVQRKSISKGRIYKRQPAAK